MAHWLIFSIQSLQKAWPHRAISILSVGMTVKQIGHSNFSLALFNNVLINWTI